MSDLVTQLRELSEHIAWLGAEADLSNAPELLSEAAARIAGELPRAFAMIAAEREACAQTVDEYKDRADARASVSRRVGKHEAAERHEAQSGAAVSIASSIRALTPADAQAALERVKREARNEALREAANTARRCKDMPPEDAILALMEDTDDE